MTESQERFRKQWRKALSRKAKQQRYRGRHVRDPYANAQLAPRVTPTPARRAGRRER